ncbi:MAG: multiheme c-type cytochrome [Nitrospirota bacterium]|nr:multiheme c-type cytochrome [Nitrospirota bacterium]MDH5767595.1 multiheme c-type cytochrome [Nitrospirota bacterium]
MKYALKYGVFLFIVVFLFFSKGIVASEKAEDVIDNAKLSSQTQACIGCHNTYTPGIVKDWLSSRHSKVVPAEALKKNVLQRRISAETLPKELSKYCIGCYECHSQNPENHKDNFEHMGYRINVIVTPNDCKTCHPTEAEQYSESKKAHAIKNLIENPVYNALTNTITGVKRVENGKILSEKPSGSTLHETCLGCHGTKVKVKGMKKVNTQMGEILVPDFTNWTNQGVGRENPDGSLGACSACHPRHGFSIEVARKPYTCAQCHLEPDVPAWNVYKESKHGNIYFSKYHEWNFDAVPWTVGKDFKAPTCATCHNSLLVSPGGEVIAERTHNFGSRLWVRLFGLVYSHSQPKSGNTTIIKNKDGLPLPTTFTGEPASEYLIDKTEQEKRFTIVKNICNSCHSTDWINNHFTKLEETTKETDKMTLAATKLMSNAWENKIEDRTNPFDEPIEQMWIRQWVFYSNSIRYASAMTGAPDYASFKNGWWSLSENLQRMKDWTEFKKKAIR